MTSTRFSAVLFDCDGVLVDSEIITLRVFGGMLREMGWDISEEECLHRFVGRSFLDHWPEIHEHTGVRIDEEWILGFRKRRDEALRAELQPVPGAPEAVAAVSAEFGTSFACASGADLKKVRMQLELAGLAHFFGNRTFSGMDTPRSKPAPDVYLAAAEALRVDPTTAVVVEDSVPGIRSGVAAGATVFAFAPPERPYGPAAELLAAGAHRVFGNMAELPELLLSSTNRGKH